MSLTPSTLSSLSCTNTVDTAKNESIYASGGAAAVLEAASFPERGCEEELCQFSLISKGSLCLRTHPFQQGACVAAAVRGILYRTVQTGGLVPTNIMQTSLNLRGCSKLDMRYAQSDSVMTTVFNPSPVPCRNKRRRDIGNKIMH